MRADSELINLHRKRAAQIANIIFISFSIVVIRLIYLQIYRGDLYHQFSLENRLRKEIVRAPRGQIFDRNDEVLVDNTPRFDAIVTRQYLANKSETIKRLSEILGLSKKQIYKNINKHANEAKYVPIVIKKNISREEMALIETENDSLPGVSVDTFISRDYTDKNIGAHLLGYISEITKTQLPKLIKRDTLDYNLGDFIGQFGVEEQVDKTIRGENGFEYVEVDALGRKKRYVNSDNLFQEINNKSPKVGNSVRLTIDRDMQKVGYDALKGESGSVVAVDIKTGEILTMISTPAFDPSQFSRGLTQEYWSSLINNEENPLRDRNIQEHFSPGSTFKPFTAIAALEENVITPSTQMQCHGSMKFGRRVYRSWKQYGDEKANVEDALMQSCNIFFYKIGAEMDIDVLSRYARMFGFGKRTGVKLPREVSGLIPTREWKLKRNGIPWQDGETLSCAIGQSYVLVSTLQLANAYAAIASKGNLFRPFVIKDISNKDGKIIKATQPELLKKIELKESTWKAIQNGLYKVANSPKGTAFWRRGLGNQMAGKTGTSQVIRAKSAKDLYSKCSDMERKYRHHGVFVGFAPYDNPRIAVASLVEHGCGGSSAAAPIAEKVISKYMEKYLPEKKKENAIRERKQLLRVIKARQKAKLARESEAEGDQVE